MKKSIYEEYVKEGWILFKLVPVEKGGNAIKGRYMTPTGWNSKTKSVPYRENAIFGGIPPKHIVVLDVDIKNNKKGDISFANFVKDSGIEFNGINVKTPSGGYHVYLEINEEQLFKKHQSNYPDIDFIVNGREFVVLGGQEIEDYGEYELFNAKASGSGKNLNLENILELRQEYDKISYSDIDIEEHYMTREARESIEEWLSKIDPDIPYDAGWRDVVMALNQWDLGGDVGFEILKKWNDNSVLYEISTEDLYKKYKENVSSTPDFWKKLIGIANSNAENQFVKRIKEAKDTDELMEIVDDIAYSTISNEKREELNSIWRERFSVVPNPSNLSKKQTHTLRGLMGKKEKSNYELNEYPNIFMIGSTNYVLEGKTLLSEITNSNLKKTLRNIGYKDAEIEKGINDTKQIFELKQTPDYLINDNLVYELEQIEERPIYRLYIKHNPLYGWHETTYDERIKEDFFKTIWQNKIEDIVKIIALSIKTNERKLNRLMLIAPSNTGKSEIFNHLGFQKIVMKRLVNAMNGDKGIGSQIIEGLKRSGLMLIDEANTSLTSEIKDMDKELHVDQFGVGGTQVIPLLFTALTSTHATATRNASDELFNRFLQVELINPKYTLNDSHLFKEDREKYTTVVRTYMINLFLETLKGEEGKKELVELQEKYRLPLNNDLDEFLFDVSEKIVSYIKTTASYNGNIVLRSGQYYIQRKKDLVDTIEDMIKELPSIDSGKYVEKMTKHFVSEIRKSIKIDDSVKKAYVLNVFPYSEDKEKQIISMFDDLDVDDL